MKKLAVMLLAVAFCAGAANADTLVFSGATYDAFITTPVAVGDGSESLLGFELYLVNTTGDSGFDASAFDGEEFGYTGFTGVMHQHYSTQLQPTTPNTDSAQFATSIDTHFAFATGDMLIVSSPTEDVASAGTSDEASDAPPPFDTWGSTDFGNSLTGIFAVDAASTLTLAYFVVADPGEPLQQVAFGTGLVNANFFMSGTSGGEILEFGIGVPEPATMGLLAIGGLGALIRRRK